MKYLKSILLLLILSTPAMAQVKLGVTAGLNINVFTFAEQDFKDYVDKARPGLVIGPTAIFTVPKTGLGADISALFDMRSAKLNIPSGKETRSETIHSNAIQFPVNLRYGITFGDMVYGFISTGPQFGVSLSEKEKTLAHKTGDHNLELRWVNNSSTFCWNFGIGGVVMDKVQVRVNFSLALKNTGELQQVDVTPDVPEETLVPTKVLTSGKAHACQVMVSYLF